MIFIMEIVQTIVACLACGQNATLWLVGDILYWRFPWNVLPLKSQTCHQAVHIREVTPYLRWGLLWLRYYNGVIMSAMASQITSLTFVYSIVYSRCRSKKTSKCGGFLGDRWIPRTNGHQCGKCFHLMTSSWSVDFSIIEIYDITKLYIAFVHILFIVDRCYCNELQWHLLYIYIYMGYRNRN